MAMVGPAGDTAIETRVGAPTVSTSPGEVIPFKVAVIDEVPVATPVARPAALMVATLGVPEVQVAVAVKF